MFPSNSNKNNNNYYNENKDNEINNYKYEIQIMKSENKKLNEENKELKFKLEEKDVIIDNFQINNQQIDSKIKNIENKNALLNDENKKLRKQVDKYIQFSDKNKELEKKLKDNQNENINLKEKITNLENIINDLNSKINKYKNDYNEIYRNYNSNKRELKEKEEKIRENEMKLNLMNEEKKNILFKNQKTIDDLNKIQNEYKNEIKQKDKKINSLENILKDKESKFKGVINSYEDMNNKIKIQEQQITELKEYKKENIHLKEKNEELNNIVNENKTRDDYIKKSSNEYYDVVVDINSIFSLKNEGWRILYNEGRKEIYNKIIGELTIKIGVLGLNNVGKSYLLSKIVKVDIPNGYSIQTKGISIKYSEECKGAEKGICILDSAGFETPLLKNEKNENIEKKENIKEEKNELENNLKYDEIEDELSRDKAQTERFIEQLIISLSDMLILVIGKLTRTEQRLISRIKNMCKKNESHKIKSIIIVHNLAQYHKNEEIKNHIEQYLLKSATFNLKKQKVIGIEKYENREYFVEEKCDSEDLEDLEVFHYIMAKEGTEAGKEYNNLTMELIKNQYNFHNQRKEINIPDEIIKLFSELSTEILGEKMECQKKDENTIILADKINKNNENENNQPLHVQNMYVDQDGNYLKNKRKFEPKYSLYYYKEKDKNNDDDDDENYIKYLLLRLEIPGNIIKLVARSTDPKKEKYKGIIIKGIKKNDEINEEQKDDFTTIYDNRNYENFSYFIELKNNLQLAKTSPIGNTQIYEFNFDKRNKDKKDKKNEVNENKNSDIIKIASGVYIMKFQLTEQSFIPNK